MTPEPLTSTQLRRFESLQRGSSTVPARRPARRVAPVWVPLGGVTLSAAKCLSGWPW